jgi:hypothetical protein
MLTGKGLRFALSRRPGEQARGRFVPAAACAIVKGDATSMVTTLLQYTVSSSFNTRMLYEVNLQHQ